MIDGQEQQPPQEDQPQERVIELNEWFTPFQDYDSLPYESISRGGNPEPNARSKRLSFRLSNVGNVKATLYWGKDLLSGSKLAANLKYLLVLPGSEQIIKGNKLKAAQEKMETRPMDANIWFNSLDEDQGSVLSPYRLEAELPSGTIISRDMLVKALSYQEWEADGEDFSLLIPDTSFIMERVRMRFVPAVEDLRLKKSVAAIEIS